jgi:hypothetical protein
MMIPEWNMDTHTTSKVQQQKITCLSYDLHVFEYIAYYTITFITFSSNQSMASIFIEAPKNSNLVVRRECGSLIDLGKFQVLSKCMTKLHKRNVKFIYTKDGYLVVWVGE